MTNNNSQTTNNSHLSPSDWVETTLGEVATFSQGFQVSTNYQYPEQKEGFVRFVRIVDYTNEGEKPRYIENPERCFVNEDDLVMIRYGSQTAGKIVRGIDGVIANNTFQIKPIENIDKNWLYWFLRQDSIYQFLNKDQSSSTMPAITFTQVGKLEISLPPLPEQQAIASVLSSFDDKIELLREQNKTLEEMGQVIFGEWFGKYGVDDELPEGWRVFELAELFSFVKGKKPIETSEIEQDEFIPQILIDTFNGGKTIFANPKNTVISNEDDLIMVMDGASSGRIEFGFSGIIGSTLALLKIEKPIKSILYYFLKSKEKDIQEKTTGSAIPHTDKNKVYNYEIVLPNDEVEMQKLDTVFSDFREKIIANRFQIQSLARSRDELLPRLMSGEVRVNF